MVDIILSGGASSGGGGGGGACTIADGADVAEGATTDAAVITDTTGTVSGKLRGLVKWAFERMPASLGQKTMANSFPVVISSDQSAIPVTGGGAPANTTATGNLNALNATATIALAGGLNSVGFQLIDSSFVGTIAAEESFDAGTTWNETDLYRPLSADAFNRQARLSSPGSLGGVIHVSPGATNARLRVQTYTSGSSAATLSATNRPYEQPSNVGSSGSSVQGIALIGGRDTTAAGTSGLLPAVVTTAQPGLGVAGLVVRDGQNTVATGGAVATTGAQIMYRDVDSGAMNPFEQRQSNPAGTERGLIVRNIEKVSTSSGLLNAAAANVIFPCSTYGNVVFRLIPGTLSGTVLFEASNDGGVTYDSIIFALDGNDIGYAGTVAYNNSSTSATVLHLSPAHFNAAGWTHIRATVSAYTSGSSTGLFYGTPAAANWIQPPAQISAFWNRITDQLGLFSWDINASGAGNVRTAQLPSALVGSRLDTNIGAWLGSTAPTVGSKTSANSVPVVIASDQAAISISNTTFGVTNWLGSTAPTVGSKTSANSVPVVIASDQSTIPISGTVTAASTAIATANPPSYTEAASSALSQDLKGNLRTRNDDLLNELRDGYHADVLEAILVEMRVCNALLRQGLLVNEEPSNLRRDEAGPYPSPFLTLQ